MFNDFLIPLASGQAVSSGWTYGMPYGVTWRWTATWDLETCRKILGGPSALRKGQASAHFGVGRTAEEGVDRYVEVANRSWHAGANQTIRWDGGPAKQNGKWYSGARTTIGIETVNIGYARKGVSGNSEWINAVSGNGKQEFLIQPWPAEQMDLMIELGKYLQGMFPYLTWRDHHDHESLCPGYKLDCIGFPWAELLNGIYENENIPDIWTEYQTIEGRQSALGSVGYDLGSYGADGDWGRMSDAALQNFQKDTGQVQNGMWTMMTSIKMAEARSLL